MGLIRSLLLVLGTFAGVLNTQPGNDHQRFRKTPQLGGGDQHPGQARVQRQPCHGSTKSGDAAFVIHRAQLFKELVAVVYLALIRRLKKWELANLPQT